jgi:cell division protein FtsB
MLRSILQSRWFTFLAVVIIGFFLLLIIKLKPSLETVSQEVNNLNQKIAEAEQSLSELQKLGDYFKSAVYLEREARLKLNYKKPGESVVFVYKNQHAQSPAKPNDTTKSSTILPNWQKWLSYLLNSK